MTFYPLTGYHRYLFMAYGAVILSLLVYGYWVCRRDRHYCD